MNKHNANYIITSKPGMTPFARTDTLAQAIADSVRARRIGLVGAIIAEDATLEATPSDCNQAAKILGWKRDSASAGMDRSINANMIARDMV